MAATLIIVFVSVVATLVAVLAVLVALGRHELTKIARARPQGGAIGVNDTAETAENIVIVKRPEGAKHADTIVH